MKIRFQNNWIYNNKEEFELEILTIQKRLDYNYNKIIGYIIMIVIFNFEFRFLFKK